MKNQNLGRKRLTGPGTIAMVVGLAAFGVYSFTSQPRASKAVYYEADSNGQLRQVERPSPTSSSLAPLWKPEPEILLERRNQLGLSQEQIGQIKQAALSWSTRKADLERRLKEATSSLASNARRSVSSLHTGLGGYSELSRQFGREREKAWSLAVAILTKQQRDALTKLSQRREVSP